MTLTREINRLLWSVLLVFGTIALSAAYWAISGPDTLLKREDNPRLVAAEAVIRRGNIVDRRGVVLATSVVSDDQRVVRRYPHPETGSAVGYSSLRYGVGGAEAAFDAILRGDTITTSLLDQLAQHLLHRPQVGSDVQLTLDLAIQQAAVQAMGDQTGAVVVLGTPNGHILSLVSLPSFDPNHLDQDWGQLVEAPQKPFFNRVLQGNYQPGAMLQTPLLAAALVANEPITTSVSGATAPVTVDETSIRCAVRLPSLDLALRDAYAFACPAPFARLAERLGSETIRQALETFHFARPPTLPGYLPQSQAENQVISPLRFPEDALIKNALGQGDLTVTPLHMAVIAAAIVNDGNAPRPYILQSTHAPEATDWIAASSMGTTLPFATEKTARQLQDLMRNAVANGAALNAARPGIDIGGHAALAYSGDETHAWFMGFATLPGRRGIAIAVVLENSDDPGLAADIGGSILTTAHENLTT